MDMYIVKPDLRRWLNLVLIDPKQLPYLRVCRLIWLGAEPGQGMGCQGNRGSRSNDRPDGPGHR